MSSENILGLINLGSEEIDEFREAFAVFDRQNTGFIPVKNLHQAARLLGQNPGEQELLSIVGELNNGLTRNGVAVVSFGTFCLVMKGLNKETDTEMMREALQMFDSKGDGAIVAQELRQFLMNMGTRLGAEDVELVLRSVGVSGEGKINFEDLLHVIARSSEAF